MIYEFGSIVERFDFRAWFPREQPVEVELGSGDSGFIVERARRNPDRNFVGVERLLGRLRKLDRKGRRLGLTNLRGVRIEAGYCVEYLLPLGGVECLHIYFPDPWPKRRHWRRRLITERFPSLAWRVLVPSGHVYLRTDDPEYHAQMKTVFAAHPGFVECDTPEELAAMRTEFECDFVAVGRTIWRLAYARISDIYHRAVTATAVPAVAALNSALSPPHDSALGAPRKNVDSECDKACDQTAPKSRAETSHVKTTHHVPDGVEQESVDQEHEQSKGIDNQRQRNQHHHRPSESVQQPQKERCHYKAAEVVVVDSGHHIGSNQHCQRGHNPTLQKGNHLRHRHQPPLADGQHDMRRIYSSSDPHTSNRVEPRLFSTLWSMT